MERSEIKAKIHKTKFGRIRERMENAYKNKNALGKKEVRRDKRNFINLYPKETEAASSRADLHTLYKITKKIYGSSTDRTYLKIL